MLRRTKQNARGVLLMSRAIASSLRATSFSRFSPAGLNFRSAALTERVSLIDVAGGFLPAPVEVLVVLLVSLCDPVAWPPPLLVRFASVVLSESSGIGGMPNGKAKSTDFDRIFSKLILPVP